MQLLFSCCSLNSFNSMPVMATIVNSWLKLYLPQIDFIMLHTQWSFNDHKCGICFLYEPLRYALMYATKFFTISLIYIAMECDLLYKPKYNSSFKEILLQIIQFIWELQSQYNKKKLYQQYFISIQAYCFV